ncbi:thiopeptide-type bacteriocin biosynthesis protein [Aquimarina mytili]|uniref:Thiopeptide-type bacteriocin biosynthesis protein n=1 Tax=Aquimarina mytili TaxID=874423 RepID=A0A936ZX34_9FLAO|nr:thiopeptide-type bacteriocin biosynthesis protein [Aquimarina mytili]MBL0685912.1 thiopeptide-type bacteriocin biosynthesis protein [Aquimarina mytili]
MKRIFLLGDEWLYYKLYCGARMSDIILTETVKPLSEHLIKTKLIDKWFFIRYNDPDYHLRVRFHLHDVKKINEVILLINKALRSYVDDDIIFKIQVDTYQREIERYGSNTIEESEQMFYHESKMLLDAITSIQDEQLYFLFILKAVHQLLENFKYGVKEKVILVSRNKDNFKTEFNADKTLNKQLNKKYTSIKKEIADFFNTNHSNKTYDILDEVLLNKTNETTRIIDTILNHKKNDALEIPLNELISSYIHMMINRAFRSQQRFYELIVYDFLYKKYNADTMKTVSFNSN